MNYYKRHLGDYAKDTRTLNVYEHGVYTLLLDLYYSDEKPISSEDAEAIIRPATPAEAASLDKVLTKFFKPDGSVWRHNYADEVINAAAAKAEKNRINGPSGGRPSNAERAARASKTIPAHVDVPQGTEPTCPSENNQDGFKDETKMVSKEKPTGLQKITLATSHKPLVKDKTLGGSDDHAESEGFSANFLKAWEQYPKRMGDNPKRMAFKCWSARLKQGSTEQEMIAGVQRYLAFCTAKGDIGTSFVMQATRFFGPDAPFKNEWVYTPPAPRPGAPIANAAAERAWLDMRECLGRGKAPTDHATGEAYRAIGGSRLHEIPSWEVSKRKDAFIAAWLKESQKLNPRVAEFAASLVKTA